MFKYQFFAPYYIAMRPADVAKPRPRRLLDHDREHYYKYDQRNWQAYYEEDFFLQWQRKKNEIK